MPQEKEQALSWGGTLRQGTRGRREKAGIEVGGALEGGAVTSSSGGELCPKCLEQASPATDIPAAASAPDYCN